MLIEQLPERWVSLDPFEICKVHGDDGPAILWGSAQCLQCERAALLDAEPEGDRT